MKPDTIYDMTNEPNCPTCNKELQNPFYDSKTSVVNLETKKYELWKEKMCVTCDRMFFLKDDEIFQKQKHKLLFPFINNRRPNFSVQTTEEQKEMSFVSDYSGEKITREKYLANEIYSPVIIDDVSARQDGYPQGIFIVTKKEALQIDTCRSCDTHNFKNDYDIQPVYIQNNVEVMLCRNCVEDRVHFGFKFRKLKGRSNNINPFARHVGIELETVNGNSFSYLDLPKNLKTLVASCHDGSIRSSNSYEEDDENDDYEEDDDCFGREFVTIPLAQDKLFNTVDDLCNFLNEQNCRINRSCGFHIHFDMKNESIETVRKTFLLFSILEESLFDMLPKSRRNNRFCIPLQKDYKRFFGNSFERYWYGTNNRYVLRDMQRHKYNDTRYTSINYHALFYHGTLENRLHSGTLNPMKIKNWILINHMIIEYAKKLNMKEIMKLSGGTLLLLKIISYYEKQYPELRKYQLPEYVIERQQKFGLETNTEPIKIIRDIKPNDFDEFMGEENFKEVFK